MTVGSSTDSRRNARRSVRKLSPSTGPIVEMLLERDFAVFAINPKQPDRFRDRFTVAGAKDDRRDAHACGVSIATPMRAGGAAVLPMSQSPNWPVLRRHGRSCAPRSPVPIQQADDMGPARPIKPYKPFDRLCILCHDPPPSASGSRDSCRSLYWRSKRDLLADLSRGQPKDTHVPAGARSAGGFGLLPKGRPEPINLYPKRLIGYRDGYRGVAPFAGEQQPHVRYVLRPAADHPPTEALVPSRLVPDFGLSQSCDLILIRAAVSILYAQM